MTMNVSPFLTPYVPLYQTDETERVPVKKIHLKLLGYSAAMQ